MRLVGFRQEWVEPILTGRKTTTIRRQASALPRVGEIVGLRCRYDRPPFAHAQILAVDVLPAVEGLGDDEARADGFDTADEMRAALAVLYGDARLARVSFRLIEPPAKPRLFALCLF